MASDNMNSPVLHEHRKIVNLRHLLALVNFLAILVGTLVTRYFVLIRGTATGILVMINILWIINIVQIGFCIADYVVKMFFGKYYKWLITVSYVVGIVWFLAVVTEFIIGSVVLGDLRIDLGAIAILQLLTALIAYIVWPSLDAYAINQMTSPKVRDDGEKKAKKAKAAALRYILICCGMVVLQAGMLFAYKLPPKVYDLFSDSRQLQYQLADDGESYEVIGVYHGTSSYVNVPARYNNKPVTAIKTDALSNTFFLEGYKVTTIEIGTLTEDENGNEKLVSNVTTIEAGAINNDEIVSLRLPASVAKIEAGAINSSSLKTLTYESKADFSYSYLSCESLTTVRFEGEEAGRIVSLEGKNSSVTLEVAKDIYNNYREKNPEHMSSIRPILEDNEFVIDFYTNSDYYIESIFCTVGEEFRLGYDDLRNEKLIDKTSLVADTLAYINNRKETGTAGAKAASAFRGWYYDKDFSHECVFSENEDVVFTGNTSIYAKWIDEYTANLDWGTFAPLDQPKVLYWTNEEPIEFPVILDRVGFDKGIAWFVNDKQVTTSENITQNVILKGTWLFNAPSIKIDPSAQNSEDKSFIVSTDKSTISFNYDETQSLNLNAIMSHDLDLDEDDYSTVWTKVNDTSYGSANKTINIKNVPEAGDYVLTVTATSEWGDVSSATATVKVAIAKKNLDMGDVKLTNAALEYNTENQVLLRTGNPASSDVQTIYTYYDADGNKVTTDVGVVNAGTYKVVAEFSKMYPAEAVNYNTVTLEATLTITPRMLTPTGWSASEFTYNSASQSVYLQYEGVYSADIGNVSILYEGNTATDANQYVAAVKGVSNSNYVITATENVSLTHNWKINPMVISIKEWKLDGSVTSSFAIDYNGKEHKLEAVAEGVFTSDLGNVNFIYDEVANTTTAKNADKYTAKIIGVDNTNYTLGAESTQAWEIRKKAVSVYFDTKSPLTYSGENQGIDATLSGIVAEDLALFTSDKLIKSEELTVGEAVIDGSYVKISFSARNAGDYTAKISGINETHIDISQNYTITETTGTFSIVPKKLTVYAEGDYVYNGKTQTLLVKIDGIVKSDYDSADLDVQDFGTNDTLKGEYRENDVYYLTCTGKSAGNYAYEVVDFNNPNYELDANADNRKGEITINRKVLTASWNVTDVNSNVTTPITTDKNSVVYNFYGYRATVTFDGVIEGESVLPTYENNEAKNVSAIETVASISADYENYSFTSESMVWNITPYTVDFKWLFNGEEADGSSSRYDFVYSAEDISVVPGFTLLGTDVIPVEEIVYVSGKADILKRDATPQGYYRVAIESFGTTSACAQNYQVGENSDIRWRITPQTVTVSWVDAPNTVTYNGTYRGPQFTLAGLHEGNLRVNVEIDGLQKYLDVTSYDDLTCYNFANTESIKSADEYICNVLKIYKTTDGGSTYEVDNNYQISGTSYTYTVEKAPLTLGGWQYNATGTDVKSPYTDTTNLVYNNVGYVVTNVINETPFGSDDVYLVYSDNDYSDAKSYMASVSLAGSHANNYRIEDGEIVTLSWKINPKPINITWDVVEFTYSGSVYAPTPLYEAGAASEDDMKVYDADAADLTFVYRGVSSASDAGNYEAKISLGNHNYDINEGSTHAWSIAQKKINTSELEWSYSETVYNAEQQYPTAYYYDSARGTYIYVNDYVYPDNAKDAGAYKIKAKSLDNANYALVTDDTGEDYSITRKTINFTWGFDSERYNANDYTYDGVERVVNAYTDAYAGDVVTVTCNLSDRKIRNAGTYTFSVISIGGASAGNYILDSNSNNVEKTVNVAQRTISLSWGYNEQTAGAGDFNYDGVARTLSAYATNLCAGDVVNFTYSADSQRSPLDVGTYTVTVEGIDNANYVLSGNVNDCKEVVTVNKQTLQISWSGTDNLTYDGKEHSLKATIRGTINGKTIIVTPVYNNADSNSYVNAGTYTIKVENMGTATGATGFNADNFALPGNNSKTLTINKQVLSVSWSGTTDLTYDGAMHTLNATLTGKINGTTVTAEAVYSDDKNGAIDAGTHRIFVNSIGSQITSNASFNIDNFTLPTDGSCQKTLTIAKRQVQISWSGTTSLIYDGAAHALTAAVTDSNRTPVAFTYSNGTNYYYDAGEHTISIELDDPDNYTTEGYETSKVLTIKKQTVRPQWSGETEVVYDGNVHSLTATVSAVLSTGTTSLSVNYDNNACVNAGTHTVSVSLEDNTNYEFAANAITSKTLTIKPQAVTITWDTESEVVYDGYYHSRTAEVRGKTDGNSVSFRYIDSSSHRDVDKYTYGILELTDDNYTLDGATNTSATLTIKPQPIRIIWSGNDTYTYSGEEYSMVPQVYGLIDDVNLSGYYQFTGSTSFTNAGTYTCTITKLTNINYTLEGCEGSLSATAVINPMDVSIVWGDSEFTYNGLSHTITATVTDSYGNQIDSSAYRYVRNTYTAIGNYTAKIVFYNSANYNIVSGSTDCTWSIVQ